MTKLLYVCLDGLGDDPIPEFDGRTPLEAADTPNLDALARARTHRHRRDRRDPASRPSPTSACSASSGTTRTTSTPAAACSRRSASGWTSTTATWRTGSTSRPRSGPRSSTGASGRDLPVGRGARAGRRGEREARAARAPRSSCAPPSSTAARSSIRSNDGAPLSANVTQHRSRVPSRGVAGRCAWRRSSRSWWTCEPLDDTDAASRGPPTSRTRSSRAPRASWMPPR